MGIKRLWQSIRRRKLTFSLGALAAMAVALVFVSAGFSGCMSFQMEHGQMEKHFRARSLPPPTFHIHETEPGLMHLASVGEADRSTIVFVHGSPGSWDNLIHFLSDEELRRRARIIAVDRPGFGKSGPKQAVPSIEEQARRIHLALKRSGVRNGAVLVGHSLGGPVVSRMSVDYPEFVGGLVLVAPSMDPDLEKRKWFNYAAKFPPIKWGLSREWANSNDEIFPHKKQLLALKERLPEIKVPTIVIQGMEDDLVPPENADYVERRFVNAEVEVWRLEGVNHFIPWSRPDVMKKAALQLLGN